MAQARTIYEADPPDRFSPHWAGALPVVLWARSREAFAGSPNRRCHVGHRFAVCHSVPASRKEGRLGLRLWFVADHDPCARSLGLIEVKNVAQQLSFAVMGETVAPRFKESRGEGSVLVTSTLGLRFCANLGSAVRDQLVRQARARSDVSKQTTQLFGRFATTLDNRGIGFPCRFQDSSYATSDARCFVCGSCKGREAADGRPWSAQRARA